MKQALLIIDVQPCFNPPDWQVDGISRLTRLMHSIATVERHDEGITPFWRQLEWKPALDDQPLVATDKMFVKHGYTPPAELIRYLKDVGVERVLVCGIQADTCCLAAGFLLFDAGLHPTMLMADRRLVARSLSRTWLPSLATPLRSKQRHRERGRTASYAAEINKRRFRQAADTGRTAMKGYEPIGSHDKASQLRPPSRSSSQHVFTLQAGRK